MDEQNIGLEGKISEEQSSSASKDTKDKGKSQ